MNARVHSLSLAAAAALLATASAVNPLTLTLDATTKQYMLSVAGGSFDYFSLASADTFVVVNGKTLSSGDGSLVSGAPASSTGADAWGSFNATWLDWTPSAGGSVLLRTTFRVYNDVPAVTFEQSFPAGVPATGGAYAQRDGVASAFPSFVLPAVPGGLGFMQHLGPFVDDGTNGPRFGPWSASAPIASGLTAGSGPITLFDTTAAAAVVLSAASQFMAGSSAVIKTAGGGSALAYGVMGSAKAVPAGFSYTTVAWYGGAGINTAVQSWGAALLLRYGKAHGLSKVDFTNTKLGYNTDHGAYYYYTTGTPGVGAGKFADYGKALLAVANEANEKLIPYRFVLLDSWWYFKGVGGGVLNWTAMPSPVFEGGNAGIAALLQATGWKLTAHNRYWARDTSYAKANGGAYDFFVDTPGSPAGGSMAWPETANFWVDLLQNATREIGLTTYEQDWLYNELEGVDVMTSDVATARTWLLQMNEGALQAGVSMQMCMAYPRHLLQSVEMAAVTQVRASDDHVPCETSYYNKQWRLGFSSMFAWAVGVAPFKDNAWSTSHQPGGSCGEYNETSPGLHLAISVFSAGPVTPGDGVGFANASAIMRTCAASGEVLAPSRAMTAIDAAVVGKALGPGTPRGAVGDVYATYSTLAGGLVWDHVLAADLPAPFAVTPADLAAVRGDLALRAPPGGRPAVPALAALARSAAAPAPAAAPGAGARVAYSVPTDSLSPAALTVLPFTSAGDTIPLPKCGEVDFVIWHTAPVLSTASGTWALLGELGKYVPVSEARFAGVDVGGDGVFARVRGTASEAVALTFWDVAGSQATTVTCVLDATGTARVGMPGATCV